MANEQYNIAVRFSSPQKKQEFEQLAQLLHTTSSKLGQEILENHLKSVAKEKSKLSGYDLFFGKK